MSGLVDFDSLGGTDDQRVDKMNSMHGAKVVLPLRTISTSHPVELWSALTMVAPYGPAREYGTRTVWKFNGQGSVFKFVRNQQGYPSDGSPRDINVIGIQFSAGSQVDFIEDNQGHYQSKTLWYCLFRDVGFNGFRHGWKGHGDGTVFMSGVSHAQAYSDTFIDVGGAENTLFGSEFSFMDTHNMDNKPAVISRMEKSVIGQAMITGRKGITPLVVDGGNGLRIHDLSLDSQDSDPVRGSALVVRNHDGLQVYGNTFKGMSHDGKSPIIDVQRGSASIFGNTFSAKAGGPPGTPLIKAGSGTTVKAALNQHPGYTGVCLGTIG